MQGEHGAVYAEREFMCPLCRSLANTLVPLSPLTTAGVEGRAPAPATPATPATLGSATAEKKREETGRRREGSEKKVGRT